MKKTLFIIATLLLVTCSVSAQYVDLGLPSGTKWKSQNEPKAYTYAYALRYFDGFLPTSGQFQELIDNCTWKWTGDGYRIIGRNGKSIYLASEFYIHESIVGAYWSRTTDENGCCYGLLCYPQGVKVDRTCSLDRKRNIILCK